MLGFLEESLDYLNNLNIKNPIEVVVNDFWVLNLLHKKYTNIKPIFGRVIHKLLKTPLIDTFWYEVHPAWELIKNKSEQEIKVLRDEIIKWQLRFYNSAEISLDIYQSFLKRFWVERVAIDYMEKREELYKNYEWKITNYKLIENKVCDSEQLFAESYMSEKTTKQSIKNPEINSGWLSIGIDLYYPWALVFTGRLCDTSAIENPTRWYYATDDICPRTCNRYDIHYKIKTVWYKLLQRWNAWYRSEINLDYLKEDFIKNENNRLIFAPFVAV